MKKTLSLLIIVSFVVGAAAFVTAAVDEKGSVKGSDHDALMESKKGEMQAAMSEFVDSNTTDGVFELEDVSAGKIRKLSYEGLHEGVGMKNGKHYSCADFKDLDTDEILDVDIYVDIVEDSFKVVDAVIHKVDGKKVGEGESKMKGSDHDHKGSDHDHKGSKGSGY